LQVSGRFEQRANGIGEHGVVVDHQHRDGAHASTMRASLASRKLNYAP
jgi:hypothetical protein